MLRSVTLQGRRGIVLPGPGYIAPAARGGELDFESYVRAEAPKLDLKELRSAYEFIGEVLAFRQAAESADLRVGARVHSSHLDYEWHTYGIVTELDDVTALIAVPGRDAAERVVLAEQHVRVLSEDEWAHVEPRLLKRNERIAKQRKGEPETPRP
jgi:hypothetical protein